ncbi:hypothetical protein N7534_007850 [Penicillium rubens]|uniref:Response regulatory domain-containing protein n=1 Tax=Penicillium chrysogenum TaxID=5076 RepID=A0ABQ8WGS4_PENCH|nr:hypothetical protein N7505_007597 [Penicillium chrysogenum]KAJ5849161.1 hypothetical protein N7534_007850 [Penicillium rubens]
MGVGRRVWIKRSTGSATSLVVDELRDLVVLKFANSLGRRFDSPDIVITITPRVGTDVQAFPERRLSPNEVLSSVLDTYYPGGQTIQEALVADVLTSRIAELSTRRPGCCDCYMRPDKYSSYLFRTSAPAPGMTISETDADSSSNSILTTAETSSLSSYGIGGGRRRDDSPGVLREAYNLGESRTSTQSRRPLAVSIPTEPTSLPQAAEVALSGSHPGRNKDSSPPPAFGSLIEGSVPPINVLIVEDNVINRHLLEAFMKRLNVRWMSVADGAEAVRNWRHGGFHLVLMDIQLPIMSGLDATREIRRLERLNGIGVFSRTLSDYSNNSGTNPTLLPSMKPKHSISEEDVLANRSMFHSPVVIVALTASSLQNDRQEALTAGCNDFLTKV